MSVNTGSEDMAETSTDTTFGRTSSDTTSCLDKPGNIDIKEHLEYIAEPTYPESSKSVERAQGALSNMDNAFPGHLSLNMSSDIRDFDADDNINKGSAVQTNGTNKPFQLMCDNGDSKQSNDNESNKGRITTKTYRRAKINMRERKRMRDLNRAMDSLREVMPHANSPSVRRLSKIATLSLARNYIQMLTKSVDDLRRILNDIYRNNPGPLPSRVGRPRLVSPAHQFYMHGRYENISLSEVQRACVSNNDFINTGFPRGTVSSFPSRSDLCSVFGSQSVCGYCSVIPKFNGSS